MGLTFTYYTGSTATGTPLSGAATSNGTYTVVAAFAGSTDYVSGSAQTTFTIGQATPKVAVTDAGGTYTGSPFAATATVAGVNGTPGSTLEGVGLTFTYYVGSTATGTPLAGAPTSNGTYTVVAAFAGSSDYSSGSAQTTFTIGQATPKVAVTDAGGTYNGKPYPATGTVAGVSGVRARRWKAVGLTFTYYAGSTASGTPLAGAPTNAGTYTVVASFAGSTDYVGWQLRRRRSRSDQATPKVVVTDPSGPYTGNPFQATDHGHRSTAHRHHAGSGGLTFTYYAGSTATGTPLSTSRDETVGTYTVVATVVRRRAGLHTAASAPVTFSISRCAGKRYRVGRRCHLHRQCIPGDRHGGRTQ